MNRFVGRADSVATLRSVVADRGKPGLRLVSVSGPGGIGKSFFVDHALAEVDLTGHRFLKLQSSKGEATSFTDFVVRGLVRSSTQLDAATKYFARVRECAKLLDRIEAEARRRIEKATRNDAELRATIQWLAQTGISFAGLVEKLGEPRTSVTASVVRALLKHVENKPERALKAADLVYDAAAEARVRGSLAARLRRDARGVVAEAFVQDLHELLVGWEKKHILQLVPPKAPALDRLLVVVDDYEALDEAIQTAFVHTLVPQLGRARFESVVVVVGRDSIVDVHQAWTDRFDAFLRADIRLDELSPDDARTYVRERGVNEDSVVERIVADTRGFPFLLAGEVDAELRGGSSAMGLMGFVERTTRWMTDQERAWLVALCFLDEVNEDTIPLVLPDESSSDVLAWFKRESSIRSPIGSAWQVLPIVRSRVQAYVKLDSPRRYERFRSLAAREAGDGHRATSAVERVVAPGEDVAHRLTKKSS
jgi:hypothetical protein